ncbi:hypothetical protein FPQ18DRAFT_338833 [Pyronema domesticum]|nr:hypothetical protein FPQ18DRAFT_338833 [Pyronema domesticum]
MPTAGTEEEDEGVIAIPTGRSEAAIVSKPVAKPTAAAPVVIEEEGAAEESAAGEEGTATEGQDTETGKKAKAPKKPRAPRKPRAKKGEAAPPEGQAAATEATEDETTEAPKEKKPRKLRKPREPKPLDPDAPPVKRGRKRAVTPEDAETRTIDDNAVKMKDLVKDPGIGRTSKRGKQLASLDWNEVVKRQRAYKAELAARRAAGEKEDMKNTDERLSRLAEEASANRVAMAPQMRIVDGVITLDQESLRVDRHQRDAVDEEAMEVVEEDVHTRLVNSGTHSKKEKGDRWPAAETERFYEALSMFGTDFGIISKMFPGRSRRMVKNKFNCEERKNGPRVTQALKTRVRADLNEYSQIAGLEFPDPAILEEELQKLRDEHEEEGKLHLNLQAEAEKERQELANAAMREAEAGIGATGPKKKKARNAKDQKSGEVVLSMSIEEYERERLRRMEEEED